MCFEFIATMDSWRLFGSSYFQALKPFLRAYEWSVWHWYHKRHRHCFDVLGSHMTVLRVDEGVSRELAVHRIHEPLATLLLQQHLKPGMTVVDVGSNIGYYALLESAPGWTRGQGDRH